MYCQVLKTRILNRGRLRSKDCFLPAQTDQFHRAVVATDCADESGTAFEYRLELYRLTHAASRHQKYR